MFNLLAKPQSDQDQVLQINFKPMPMLLLVYMLVWFCRFASNILLMGLWWVDDNVDMYAVLIPVLNKAVTDPVANEWCLVVVQCSECTLMICIYPYFDHYLQPVNWKAPYIDTFCCPCQLRFSTWNIYSDITFCVLFVQVQFIHIGLYSCKCKICT